MSITGSLFRPTDVAKVHERLARLTPETDGQWGKMTVHQAICHQTDALEMALGHRPAAPRKPSMPRLLLRIVALRLPLAWPHGVPTVREANQDFGGTAPTDFEADRSKLKRLIDDFAALPKNEPSLAHPVFGKLSHADWGRWAYRHSDHHLRQFGV